MEICANWRRFRNFALFQFTTKTMITEQNKELDDQIREIKRRLRAAMNGVLSGSMRQSGIDYRVNFGVDQPRLAEIAAEIPHTYALSATLWKDNIREMRLLAAMTMPQEDFDEELAMLWVEQLRYAEEAQVLVLHLLQHRPYASSMAFRLVAADAVMPRLVGWLLLGRLFMANFRPTQRDADELLDHVCTELSAPDGDLGTKRAALNMLYKFMDLGEAEAARGERLLKQLGL